MDRRVLRAAGGLSGALHGQARRNPSRPAGRPTRTRRRLRRRVTRPGRDPAAWHHPLAAPVLLRVLPGERERPRDPGRPAGVGSRRSGHDLGDLPRSDRARDARARLAGRTARPTAAVSFGRTGRRRDPALRIGRRLGRLAGRDSPGDGWADGTHRRRHRAAHRVHVEPDPLIGGESVPSGRPRHGRAAHDRRRSGNLGRATRSPASRDRGRPGRGLHAGARRGICRHHWYRGDRPGGGAGPDRAQLRRVAARRCRLGRCCGGLPRAALAQ